MSKIRKKKPASQKKKNKTKADQESDSTNKAAAVITPKKVKLEKTAVDAKTGNANFFVKSIEFFREVKVELQKVTWPTRKQTTGTTIVVIIFVFVVAAFLGLFDFGLSKLVQAVLS